MTEPDDIDKNVNLDDLKFMLEMSLNVTITLLASLVGVAFGLYSILSLMVGSIPLDSMWVLLTLSYILVALVGHILYSKLINYTALFWYVADRLKREGERLSMKEKHDYLWKRTQEQRKTTKLFFR